MIDRCGVIIAVVAVLMSNAAYAGYHWTSVDSPAGVYQPVVTAWKGNVYVMGGMPSRSASAYSDVIWAYSPTEDTWEQKGTLPYGFDKSESPAPLVVGDTMIYSPRTGPSYAGGWGSHEKMIEYSFTDEVARETADLPGVGRIWNSATAQAGDGNIYVLGGWTGSGVSTIWQYDPEEETAVDTGARMPFSGAPITHVVDGEGKVLIMGATRNHHGRMCAFDPNTMTCEDYGNVIPEALRGPSPAHTVKNYAYRDNSGRIMIVGSRTDTIWEYNPGNRSFALSEEWTLPETDGTLTGEVYDPKTGTLYVTEMIENNGDYETRLWIGKSGAVLTYNIATGQLTMDTQGATLNGFIIASGSQSEDGDEAGDFTGQAELPDGFTFNDKTTELIAAQFGGLLDGNHNFGDEAVVNGGLWNAEEGDWDLSDISFTYTIDGQVGSHTGLIELISFLPGDVDMDGDVDASDIQAILSVNSYENGSEWSWAEGDFNGDGLVDAADIQMILEHGQCSERLSVPVGDEGGGAQDQVLFWQGEKESKGAAAPERANRDDGNADDGEDHGHE